MKKEKKEFYYYVDNDLVIMGRRGYTEYRMNRDEFMKTMLRRRLDIHSGAPDYEKILDILIEESQVIDFEEIPNETKLLS